MRIDKVLACLDALGKRMDAFEGAPRGKGREEDDEPEGEIEEPGKPRPLAADSQMIRKDSVADEEEIANFTAEHGATYKVQADAILAAVQSDADRAASAWGKSAKQPWDAESITAYRRRVAREHQQYSPSWKGVDLSVLSGQSLRNATKQIFADSITASSAQDSYGKVLREIRRRDPDTGHLIKEYYGSPMAWMSQFTGGRRFAKFNLDRRDRG